jgi:hypothetical protein
MSVIRVAIGEVSGHSDTHELRTVKEQAWRRPAERGEDDPLAPARGIVLGLAISLSMWAVLIWLVCWLL